MISHKLGYVSPSFAGERASLKALRHLLREARPYYRLLAAVQVIGLSVAALSTAVPFGLKYMTRELQHGNTRVLLWAPGVALLVVAAVGVGRAVQSVLANHVATRIGKDLQQRVYDYYLELDFRRHLLLPLGGKLARVSQEVQSIVQGFSVLFSSLLYAPALLLVFGGIMIATSFKLAAIAVLAALGNFAVSFWIGRHVRRNTRGLQEQYVRLSRHVLDTLGEIMLVKIFARDESERARFAELAEENRRLQLASTIWSSGFSPAMQVMNALSICLVAWFAFYLMESSGGLAIPDLVKFAAFLYLFQVEIVKIGTGIRTLSAAGVGCERVFGMLETPPVEPGRTAPGTGQRPGFSDALAVEDVTFGYDARPVLEGISLVLRPGERIALCGISGAGKTTLVRVLVGLLRPDGGTVKLDGVEAGRIDPVHWRSLFSVAPQNPVLFDMSIRDNIAYGKPDASLEEVERAARLACADEFIARFPAGYDTLAGEAGRLMSSGQRQRITIARALLRGSPILVLDEPCSDLDVRTEQAIFASLRETANRAIVMISHRLNAIRDSDRIYYLADGKITESGTHEELMRTSGDYRNLYALQTIGDDRK